VADDCRGVEVMVCGVDVSASNTSDIDLGGGCQVAWANLAEVVLSLAVTRMLAQVHSWVSAAAIGWQRSPCICSTRDQTQGVLALGCYTSQVRRRYRFAVGDV
jgi:hypothetical protein